MINILITGATGNVGLEVIKSIEKSNHHFNVFAGVRDLIKDQRKFDVKNLKFKKFDFEDPLTYEEALDSCNILFLLRPPHLSNVEKYFKPILNVCIAKKVKHIIFLSVQGVESSKIIPHHKIEKLIVESGINYTFLRPAYFMQNFTTTLKNDLVVKNQIFLPAGNAKFTLIDVRDIGSITAKILTTLNDHLNKSYELTSNEKLTFKEMTNILNAKLKVNIEYNSPNLLNFFLTKKKEKVPTMLILVMIMLHYLPRFKKEPNITKDVQQILHRPAITFEEFTNDHKELLLK